MSIEILKICVSSVFYKSGNRMIFLIFYLILLTTIGTMNSMNWPFGDSTMNSMTLHYAVQSGDHARIIDLLDSRANINATDYDNGDDTPLHVAVRGGIGNEALNLGTQNEESRLEVVRLLLQRQANVNAQNICNHTPLHLAAYFGCDGIVRILLENNANVSITTTDHNAQEYESKISRWISKFIFHRSKYRSDNTEPKGNTPLHEAASQGHTAVVELLLQYNADANAVGRNDDTPLHLAAHFGRVEIIPVLCSYGASLDALDYNGRTPLDRANLQNHTKAIIELNNIRLKHMLFSPRCQIVAGGAILVVVIGILVYKLLKRYNVIISSMYRKFLDLLHGKLRKQKC